MKQLLLATNNPGKVGDFEFAFRDDDIELLSLKDVDAIDDIEETGKTYLENAAKKAKEAFAATGIPSLADDSGFEVDHLDGFPGLHSARWLGDEANDYDKALAILNKMKGVPRKKRTARLVCVLVFWDGNRSMSRRETIEGYIPENLELESVQKGFPYRSILYIPEYEKLYSDFSEKELLDSNHRIRGVRGMKGDMFNRLR